MSGLQRSVGQQSTVEAYIVVDFHSKKILSSHQGQMRRQVASLTKIATAMVVLDWAELTRADLSELAIVPASGNLIGGPNRMNLRPGERISLRDALYCALIGSDNWAAETLANHVGRDLLVRGNVDAGTVPVEEFVNQMNALAERQGAKDSLFTNPHGMDHLEKLPHSSAADIARLAIYALGKPSFTFFCSQKERKVAVHGQEGVRHFMIKNTNKLLGKDGIDGIKTGLTRRAGPCLAISADRKPIVEELPDGRTRVTPRRLIVVVLGASDRFAAARSLLIGGWEKFDAWNSGGRLVLNPSEFLSGAKE
ncbi:MAG: D-alanyl-D-alanine carboxypeptidase [Verrucomicrobiaceae bacterium]|nr:D-alanyl-D-alanine carboxypeptidase [Verrucomicrobiaceae bacterium]